uniref:MFMR domain-containing protein n=1 Tax=Heterorhabditis bacteriophora TaxID=37862 RepID=A0A1I7X692_HETBA
MPLTFAPPQHLIGPPCYAPPTHYVPPTHPAAMFPPQLHQRFH